MLSKRELRDYKNMLSDILCIRCPEIEIDGSAKGAYLLEGKVYINPKWYHEIADENYSEEYFERYGIAHEFRHYWQQAKMGVKEWENCYESHENYNTNPLEVDANAFAALVLTIIYNYEKHVGIEKESVPFVQKRMEEIYWNEYPTRDLFDKYS